MFEVVFFAVIALLIGASAVGLSIGLIYDKEWSFNASLVGFALVFVMVVLAAFAP